MSIKKDLLSGVFFTAVAKYSGILVTLCVTAVLSRLLTPEDFGIVGVATVIIAFFNILGDIGIGPAIIQRDNLSYKDLVSIHSFTTLMGAALAVIFFFGSWLIAYLYDSQALVHVCQILSLTILFTCWGIVPTNLQYKAKRFKKIALVTLLIQIITGAISIVYAFYGGGVYALVISSVLSAFFMAAIYNMSSRMGLRFRIDIGALRKIMSFSAYQFLFNILTYFSRNMDKLLIGRYIGLSQLGYYEKSYRLMMLPLQNITFVINPVILPIFSSLQHDLQHLGERYLRLLQPLAYLSFPISVILFFCSPELILLIFGDQWGPSIKPLQILSFTVGLQILTSTTGGIYQSANATRQMLVSGVWGASFMLSGFGISIYFWHTIEAVCYSYLFAQLANTIQCFWLLFRTLDMNVSRAFALLVKPIMISAIVFLLMWCEQHFFVINEMFISLIVKGIYGCIVSLLLVQLFSPYNVIKIIGQRIRTVIKK